jgi:hypothetical protein
VAIDFAPPKRLTRSATAVVPPLSVCAWIRPDVTGIGPNSNAGAHTIWYQGTTSYTASIGFYVNLGALGFYFDFGTGKNVFTPLTVAAGVWSFVGFTFDKATGALVTYKREEGEPVLEVHSQTVTGIGTGVASSNHMAWGGAPDGADQQMFDGAMMYGRLFPSLLSQADLLAESGSVTAVATEHADWPMVDLATVANDISGNNRTLTITGTGTHTTTPNPNISLSSGVVLNTANAVRLGANVVNKIILRGAQVWPRPISTTGLRVWLDAAQLNLANGAAVSPWPDLSGNGFNGAVVGTPAPTLRTNALKGLPVVRLSSAGNSGRYRWGSTWSNAHGADKNMTFFAIVRMFLPGNSQRVISGVNNLGSNQFFGYWQVKMDTGHTGSGFMTPDLRPAVTNDWRLYTFDSHATPTEGCRGFNNGVQILTGGGFHGWKGTLALSGYDGTGIAEMSDCEFGELILYDRELPDVERQQVEAYLREKWL